MGRIRTALGRARVWARLVRLVPAVTLVAAIALVVASSASAANLAPNPGFEVACGSPTKACSWYELTSTAAVAQRDDQPANAHTGSASYHMQILTSDVSGLSPPSDCQPATAAGNLPVSYWYRSSDTNVSISVEIWFYDTADCTGAPSSVGSVSPAVQMTDGSWHEVTGSVSAEAKVFNIRPALFCSNPFAGCPGVQVWFDDVVVGETPPTVVTLTSIVARPTLTGVLLQWRTAHGAGLLGFNVYRESRGKLVKLNRMLIPSVLAGTSRGRTYSWLDRNAPRTATVQYRVQAVNRVGTRSWIGSAVLRR